MDEAQPGRRGLTGDGVSGMDVLKEPTQFEMGSEEYGLRGKKRPTLLGRPGGTAGLGAGDGCAGWWPEAECH